MRHRTRLPDTIQCAHCDVVFKPRCYTTKYCSVSCQIAHRRKPRITPKNKRCSKCGKRKPSTAFHTSKKAVTGLQAQCKNCQQLRVRTKPKRYVCETCGQLRSVKGCSHCSRQIMLSRNNGHAHNYTGSTFFAGRMLATWKGSAKRRGHCWRLTKEQLDEQFDKQKGKCALTGISMEWKDNSRVNHSPYRASIDRVDSAQGYIPGNFQFVCSIINVMKNKLPDHEFVRLCTLVAKHHNTLEDRRGKDIHDSCTKT